MIHGKMKAGIAALVICLALVPALAELPPGGTSSGKGDLMSGAAPRGEVRIIHTSDSLSEFMMVPPEPAKEDFHAYVDILSANGVDVYAMDVFIAGFCMWTTRFEELYERYEKFIGLGEWYCLRVDSVFSRGWEPIEIWTERCHEKGMKFLASWRMSDRHHRGKWQDPHFAALMGDWQKTHRQFWLGQFSGGLDFSFQEVRDYMFAGMEEVVQRFDVDGIELNWIRYPHVFPMGDGKAEEHKGTLTAFHRRVRDTLDREGKKKGRKLLLSVRVPQTLEECEKLSLDIPAYVREGLIDMLCPNDWGSTDYNAPYDTFAELTADSDCRLYPAVAPYPSRGVYPRNLMSLAAYCGAVRNFYAQGADGFSTFNFTYHWSGRMGMAYPGVPENYPKAFALLAALRDHRELANKDRHYVFYPLQKTGFPALADQSADRITLARSAGARGAYTFRIAETLTSAEKALVTFRTVGLMPDDRVEIDLNGQTVPAELITRSHFPNGRKRKEEGKQLPAYARFDIALEEGMVRPIENTLAVRLVTSAKDAAGDITVPEIEVAVSVSGTDPAEIMTQIHEPQRPAMPVLAGYHPHFSSVKKGMQRTRNLGESPEKDGSVTRTKLAQEFVLERKSRIDAIDIFLYPNETEAAITFSLQTDADGKPSGQLVTSEGQVEFGPRKEWRSLNLRLQGYYKAAFRNPLTLDAGRYWFVMEKAPEDPELRRFYRTPAAYGVYKGGALWQWQEETGWKGTGPSAFFGVHGEYVAQESRND